MSSVAFYKEPPEMVCSITPPHTTPNSGMVQARGETPGSSDENDIDATGPTRGRKRTLRRALDKAAEAASRYSLEMAASMKAFDGPHLGPADVRELLLRTFRIKLSIPEASALVAHFTKVNKIFQKVTQGAPRPWLRCRRQVLSKTYRHTFSRVLQSRRNLMKNRLVGWNRH